MPFFHYSQNNSGGSFTGPAHHVVVEAKDWRQANDIAEDLGLYWDGCADGYDCSCCGDRWYPMWADDGDDTPMVYDMTPEKAAKDDIFRDRNVHSVLVRYLDGTVQTF